MGVFLGGVRGLIVGLLGSDLGVVGGATPEGAFRRGKHGWLDLRFGCERALSVGLFRRL